MDSDTLLEKVRNKFKERGIVEIFNPTRNKFQEQIFGMTTSDNLIIYYIPLCERVELRDVFASDMVNKWKLKPEKYQWFVIEIIHNEIVEYMMTNRLFSYHICFRNKNDALNNKQQDRSEFHLHLDRRTKKLSPLN